MLGLVTSSLWYPKKRFLTAQMDERVSSRDTKAALGVEVQAFKKAEPNIPAATEMD